MQAAALTASIASGIAVIALQGSDLQALFGRIFTSSKSPQLNIGETMAPRLHLGHIHDCGQTIDEVLVALDEQRRHGEIHCHGGPRIVQRILMLLQRHGVDILGWQDFHTCQTVEQEVEHALCHALTPLAVTALAAQAGPGLARWIEWARQHLEELDGLERVCHEAGSLLMSYRRGRCLLEPPTVVLAGPANAGKSTMINVLAGRNISIAADLPGTTRDWTSDLVAIDGVAVHLVDTAGLGPTSDPLAHAASDLTQTRLGRADLLVILLDAALPVLSQQVTIHLPEIGRPTLWVVNKIDLLDECGLPDRLPPGTIATSAHNGTGLAQLRAAIVAALGMSDFEPKAAMLFTTRQQEWVERLSQAKSAERARDMLCHLYGQPTAYP